MLSVDVIGTNMEELDMSPALEFAAAEAFAEVARAAINARLCESHVLNAPEFWRIVAKLYARGQPEVGAAAASEVILPPSPELYASALQPSTIKLHLVA